MSTFTKLGVFFLFLSFINLFVMLLRKEDNDLAVDSIIEFKENRFSRSQFTLVVNLGTILLVPFIANSDKGNTFIQIDILILLALICAFTCSGIRFFSFPFESPMWKPAIVGALIGVVPVAIILFMLPTTKVINLTYRHIAVTWTYFSPILWFILFYPKSKKYKQIF